MRSLALSLLLLATNAAAQSTLLPAPKSALDGTWKGTSDAGSCNSPLEIQLAIEYGFVDGTAFESAARGPVPNQSKASPPAPTPGLWQLHGTAHAGESFILVAAASVRYTDKRDGRIRVRRDGAALVLTEETGCRRTARLSR
ncbi:MAG TPA: hypothetical protein VEC14_17350 [Reyranellaceae bacterium]|nr:hypothetical protein [Reyranellaceae bacterium]